MSQPTLFCNACGGEIPIRQAMGREFKVCSTGCIQEMQWRRALSIMGKPYRPSPETEAWAKGMLAATAEVEKARAPKAGGE